MLKRTAVVKAGRLQSGEEEQLHGLKGVRSRRLSCPSQGNLAFRVEQDGGH